MASYLVAKNSFIDGQFKLKNDIVEYDGEPGANLEPISKVKAEFVIEAASAPERTGFDPVSVARAPGTEPGGSAEPESPLLDDEPAPEDPAPDNGDDELVAGNLSEIVPTLGAKSDEDLDALESAENDREAPRKGLLSAIAKEREARADV